MACNTDVSVKRWPLDARPLPLVTVQPCMPLLRALLTCVKCWCPIKSEWERPCRALTVRHLALVSAQCSQPVPAQQALHVPPSQGRLCYARALLLLPPRHDHCHRRCCRYVWAFAHRIPCWCSRPANAWCHPCAVGVEVGVVVGGGEGARL
jgi:hypothetical protein